MKKWRYVGLYGADVMLCAGVVHVAGMAQTFWAVWDGERLHERTRLRAYKGVVVERDEVAITDGAVRVQATLSVAGDPIEVVSAHGRGHIWTRKWPVHASGTVSVAGAEAPLYVMGLVDESAGYHARRTAWEWSAGVGVSATGQALAWNLVAGIHDDRDASERTAWVDGEARHLPPAMFSANLDNVSWEGGELAFTEDTRRARHDRLVLIESDYVQPFGTFGGSLGDGVDLAAGWGVMERHRARW